MKSTNSRTLKMVQLALFIAVIILMAFTPIGYIKTPGVEITLLIVPVTVGAIVLGPTAGAILGGAFGLTSFIQCFGMSPFGSALLGINPIATFILCLVPRILMGWISGITFQAVKKVDKTKSVSYLVGSLVGPILNTVFFMLALVLFFYNTDYIQGFVEVLNAKNAFFFVVAFVGINGLIEAGINFVIGSAVAKTLAVVVERVKVK